MAAGNAASAEGPRHRIDRDDRDQDRRADGDLIVGLHAQEVHAVGEHAERKHAEERADDHAAAAEQAGATDEGRRDRQQRRVVAELHVAELRREARSTPETAARTPLIV